MAESLIGGQEEREPVTGQGLEGGHRGRAGESQKSLEVLAVAETIFRSLRHEAPLDEFLEVEQILDLREQGVGGESKSVGNPA